MPTGWCPCFIRVVDEHGVTVVWQTLLRPALTGIGDQWADDVGCIAAEHARPDAPGPAGAADVRPRRGSRAAAARAGGGAGGALGSQPTSPGRDAGRGNDGR